MREKYSIGDYYKHGLALIFLKTQSQREKFEKLESRHSNPKSRLKKAFSEAEIYFVKINKVLHL